MCVFRVYTLQFRVRVLGLGFCVRVRVSITGSGSYLNENFVIFLAFVLPSGECARKTCRTAFSNLLLLVIQFAELKIVNFALLLSVCRTDHSTEHSVMYLGL